MNRLNTVLPLIGIIAVVVILGGGSGSVGDSSAVATTSSMNDPMRSAVVHPREVQRLYPALDLYSDGLVTQRDIPEGCSGGYEGAVSWMSEATRVRGFEVVRVDQGVPRGDFAGIGTFAARFNTPPQRNLLRMSVRTRRACGVSTRLRQVSLGKRSVEVAILRSGILASAFVVIQEDRRAAILDVYAKGRSSNPAPLLRSELARLAFRDLREWTR